MIDEHKLQLKKHVLLLLLLFMQTLYQPKQNKNHCQQRKSEFAPERCEKYWSCWPKLVLVVMDIAKINTR
jgi:hypothetical protein